METETLKKISFAIEKRLSEEFINQFRAEVFEMIGNQVCVRVRGYVWAENEPSRRQEVKYPRNWKEAIKERFAPAWLLKISPVKYTTIEMSATVIYPLLSPKIEGYDYRVLIRKEEKIGKN